MLMLLNNILQLVMISAAYLSLFMLIPFWLKGYRLSGKDTLDKLVGSFVCGNVAIILATLLLSLTGLYSRWSLIATLLAVAAAYRLLFRRRQTFQALRTFEREISYIIGGYYHPRVLLRDLSNMIRRFLSSVRRKIMEPVALAFTLITFGYAAYIRCYHSVVNLFYGTSDMYLHTEWIKNMMNNRPYTAGVYPFGFHATIAAISDVFGISVVTVMRMFGPIIGMLIVFALYYLLKRTMRSNFAISVALALYVVSDLFPYWASERQYMALPQELGTIFLYLTAYFLYSYMKEKKSRELILFSACVAMTLLTHFFVTVYAVLICMMVFVVCVPQINWKTFGRIAAAVACAFVLAFAPLGVGLAKGIPFNGSMDWALSFVKSSVAQASDTAARPAVSLSDILNTLWNEGFFERTIDASLLNLNWFLPYLAAAVLSLIAPVFRQKNGERRWLMLAFSLYSLLLLALFVLSVLDIFAIMEFSRLYVYFIYSLPLVVCAPFELLHGFLCESGRRARAAYVAIVCVLGATMLGWMGVNKRFMPLGRVWQSQYNGAVKAYYDIVREFPKNQWTIVSSTSEYSLCLYEGYHFQMVKFFMDMENGINRLHPPTENVFIYVQKRPNVYLDYIYQRLGAFEPLPELDEIDAHTDFSALYSVDPIGVYRDYEANRALQAKAAIWVKEYEKYFSKEMSVFYEDDEIAVYRVRQNMYALNNFAIPYLDVDGIDAVGGSNLGGARNLEATP